MIPCSAIIGVALLCFGQAPFVANPDENVPEFGQRVSPDWRPVPGLAARLDSAEPGMLIITGHVGFQIADPGGICRHTDRFMLGVSVVVNGRRIMQRTENVARGEHYHDGVFTIMIPVDAGPADVEIEARAKLKTEDSDCRPYYKEGHYSHLSAARFHGTGA